jgi:outer membrane protein OmpA-like peptidoglycan-associated protein
MAARTDNQITFCLSCLRGALSMGPMVRWICFVVLFAVAGCASPKNVFVLLPDEQGKTGAIEVHTKGGFQVVDQANQSTKVSNANSKPLTPEILSESEIASGWEAVLRNTPLQPKTFTFYFQWDTDRLTPESEAQLPNIINELKNYPAAELSIVGHTDRVGSASWNAGLSLRRAETIKTLLLKIGLRHDLIEVESHGENNPLIPTADGVPEPRNRRVEVTIR